MPEFKKRPKLDRLRAGSTIMPPKQAAHILKGKYRQQLDQRPEGSESETTDATDKVEGAGRQAVGEVTSHRPRSSRKQNPIEQKKKMISPSPIASGQEAVNSSGLIHSRKAGQQAFISQRQSEFREKIPTIDGDVEMPLKKWKRSCPLKERPRTIFKSKANAPGKSLGPTPKVKLVAKATEVAKPIAAQQRMKQQAVAKAKRATKATVNAEQKITIAAAKSVASLIGNLVGLLGDGALLVILVFIVAVAAVASSPFGIFFSGDGGTGGDGIPVVSVAEAISSVDMEYNARLEQLQAGGYDNITLTGQAADWPDVLTVFAVRYAAAEDGVDVATLDTDRVGKLTATFWDMTEITSEIETIDHPDSDPDDDVDDSWTEYILHIAVTAKTAEEMKTVYSFTDYQVSALDELLDDRVALASLAKNLKITSADVRKILGALPESLPVDRRRVVETALQLVGKVSYFWGGKSYVIGWDSRWGQLAKVTADGNSATGTYRPYGLDCTGFIDWVLRNAGLSSDGHWYVGTNLTAVTEANALPGDMALYPDASHIGIVVGRDSAGKLLICHCSSGSNNVVVTEFTDSGFTALGRPDIYAQ